MYGDNKISKGCNHFSVADGKMTHVERMLRQTEQAFQSYQQIEWFRYALVEEKCSRMNFLLLFVNHKIMVTPISKMHNVLSFSFFILETKKFSNTSVFQGVVFLVYSIIILIT